MGKSRARRCSCNLGVGSGRPVRAQFLTRALARAEEATSLRVCFLAVGLSAAVAAALASVLEQEYVDGAHVAGEGH